MVTMPGGVNVVVLVAYGQTMSETQRDAQRVSQLLLARRLETLST